MAYSRTAKVKYVNVVVERVKLTWRRGRLGTLFVGRDQATGREVRWWVRGV